MAEILEFQNYRESNNKTKDIFNKLDVNFQKYIEDNKDIIDGKFIDLYNKFKNIKIKVDKESWLSSKKLYTFIMKLDSCTYDDDIFSRLSSILEYICIVDSSKGEILDKDTEYISNLVMSLCEMTDIDIKSYPFLLSNLNNKIVQEIINNKKYDKNRKIIIQDIIDLLINGSNILEIKMLMDKDTTKNDDSVDLKSIDKIHNYYINQAMFFEMDNFEDDVFDNIDLIVLINGYNNIIKEKFIKIINDIYDMKIGIIREIKLVSNLVDIFFYFQDSIIEYDLKDIEKLLFFTNINELNIQEAVQLYNKSSGLKGV